MVWLRMLVTILALVYRDLDPKSSLLTRELPPPWIHPFVRLFLHMQHGVTFNYTVELLFSTLLLHRCKAIQNVAHLLITLMSLQLWFHSISSCMQRRGGQAPLCHVKGVGLLISLLVWVEHWWLLFHLLHSLMYFAIEWMWQSDAEWLWCSWN